MKSIPQALVLSNNVWPCDIDQY